jgi:8-oxo-dGTP pyrophosphatase MutT (NUDIX family)
MCICSALTVIVLIDPLPLNERGDAVLAATVLLLRDSSDGLEILLLKRNPNAQNMGDIWLFPGGKVDAEDLGKTETETAMNAAVREVREEAAIVLSPSDLIGFSHWLTPAGMERRFATWFFVAELPEGAVVRVDGEEMVEARWLQPRMAVEEHLAGELRLPPPTLVSLLDLSEHHSFDAVVISAQARIQPYFFPKICAVGDETVMLYPGDAGYLDGDRHVEGARHRASWNNGVIDYARSFDFPKRA